MSARRAEAPILLIKLRGIGDSVLSLPSLAALKKLYPGAPLDVLVPPSSAAVFSADKRVRRVRVYDKSRGLAHYREVVGGLRAEGYQLAFCPHASFRSALLGLLSGAKRRSVRNHSGPDWFSNVPCATPKEPKSIVEREFDGLRALGWKGAPPKAVMALGAKAKAWAKAQKLKAPFVLLASGGSVPERRWPYERFVQLGRQLLRSKRRVVWLLAPGETAPQGFVSASPPDVQALGALAQLGGFVLGNNSGPRHVAAACGARTFTLFASDLPREWHPWPAPAHRWLRNDDGRLDQVSVQAVLKAMR